jgi:hypothetical protein
VVVVDVDLVLEGLSWVVGCDIGIVLVWWRREWRNWPSKGRAAVCRIRLLSSMTVGRELRAERYCCPGSRRCEWLPKPSLDSGPLPDNAEHGVGRS